MSSRDQRNFSLERHGPFVLVLFLSFCIIFGVAFIVGYHYHKREKDAAIGSNRTSATLLARMMLEHQRATIGVLQSYARQPLLIDSIKRKNFEGALRHLADLAKNNPEVEWPYITNPDSTVWVNFPVDKGVFNKDLSGRDWYKGISREWRPYISSVYKMVVGEKELAVTVCAPVFDEKGKLIGILGAAQSTAHFRKIIGEVSSSSDIYLTLIDQEGHIICSNRFPYTKEVTDYPPLDFVGKARKGEKGDVEIQGSSDGNRGKYVSFAPIEGVGWSVIVEKGKSEVLQSEYPSFALIAVISFLIFAVVVLSLVYLRARQKQIRSLEKLNEELDGRVRERTAELDLKNQSLIGEITERKRAEREIRARDAELQLVADTTPVALMRMSRDLRYVFVNRACTEMFGCPREEIVGKSIVEVIGKEAFELIHPYIQRVLQGERVEYEVEIPYQGIGLRFMHVLYVPEKNVKGEVEGWIASGMDITERKRAEETLQKNEARFKLLSDTAGRLLTTDNPQGIVNELCRDVMAHLDCQAFFNFLVDDDAGWLRLNACAGIPEEEARKIKRLDYGVAVCGCVARDGSRIVAEDIFNVPDPRTELVKSFGIQAYACHPLKVEGRLIGTLSFGTKTRTSFSPDDLALMKTVTDQVATAMERMGLIKELRRSRDELEIRVQERTEELAKSQERLQNLASQLLLAQEKERKRVAVELHDSLMSELAATKFLLEAKIKTLDNGKAIKPGELRRIADVLASTMKEARRIMNNLHPSLLDELGLIATIRWLCGEFQKSYPHIAVQQGILVSEEDISRGIRVVIYRILQEALNNFARHGNGDRVEVSLSKSDGAFALVIRDNGQGFDVGNAGKGLGLESMRERVELSGGGFQIESVIGQGTTIRAIWRT